MAGVQLLSIPAVKEIPSSEFNSLVATLVTLLSDPEEKVQITALHTLSELAKQEVFRDAINRKLPALLESLEQEEWKIRVAALKTCAALAGDVTFCEIVKQAAPQIMACIKDPDYNVQLQALNTLSQLSREEAFWLTVSDAAPHIMSQFESPSWSIRVQVLRTLSVFIENDAFGDIINSVLPRILESLSDRDDDVRVAAAEILVTLIQHSIYQAPMRRAFQDSGLDYALSTLSDLTSDPFRSVRMAVLPLIPKVAELDVLRSTEVSTIMLSIVDLLSEDKEEDMWIAALDTISALVKQDVSYAEEIPPKPPKLTKQSVGAVVNVIPTIFSLFERTKEQRFWDAAAEVLLSLASIGLPKSSLFLKFNHQISFI
ncbi:armadillo-type protein [Mycena alexandri]|uniref:Armadillo-type protein n=1 Tax=Mycena alexandri TaxID=1745969 RepID=A0AAD6SFJ1_9AGAR|nr:armadillo-type protein [Mycena alexandri]